MVLWKCCGTSIHAGIEELDCLMHVYVAASAHSKPLKSVLIPVLVLVLRTEGKIDQTNA
jgi:hypothetical protein